MKASEESLTRRFEFIKPNGSPLVRERRNQTIASNGSCVLS